MSKPSVPEQSPHHKGTVLSGTIKRKAELLLARLEAENKLDLAAIKAEAHDDKSLQWAIKAPTLEALGWLARGDGEAHVLKGKEIAVELIPVLEKIKDGGLPEVSRDFVDSMLKKIDHVINKRLRWERFGGEGPRLRVAQGATDQLTDVQEIFIALSRLKSDIPQL